MSTEREVTDIGTGQQMSMAQAIALDPEDVKRLRAERKTHLRSVLERGIVADRLKVDLPPTLHGEWVLNVKEEIYRMQLLGFQIDTEFAPKRALHDHGDGMSVIGDTVYMTCPMEDREIMEEIRREQFEAANGKPGQTRSQKEEREFTAQTRTLRIGPTVEESTARSVRKAEIESALQQSRQAQAGTVIK